MSVRYWLASFRVDDARTAVAQAAEAGPGYVPLRLRNHVEEVRTGDIVFFWVVGEHGEEGLFAVGRVFALPGWTVVHGDPGEDEFLCAQVAWLRYAEITDHIVLTRADLERDPAFTAFELFAHPGAGNLYAVSNAQWRVLINALEPRTPGSGWPRGAPH